MSMRKIKPVKETAPLLKQQTLKLEHKLSLLRSELNQKKKLKAMNNTSTSLKGNNSTSMKGDVNKNATINEGFNKTTRLTSSSNRATKSPTGSKQQQSNLIANLTISPQQHQHNNKLIQKLRQLGMQQLQQKLKQKGINTIDQLLSKSDQEIDGWKDISVGLRIKIKKSLKVHLQKQLLIGGKKEGQQLMKRYDQDPQQQQQQCKQSKLKSLRQKINQQNMIKRSRLIEMQQQQQQQQHCSNNKLLFKNQQQEEEEEGYKKQYHQQIKYQNSNNNNMVRQHKIDCNGGGGDGENDIQRIIERRNQMKVFVAMDRRCEEEDQNGQGQYEEERVYEGIQNSKPSSGLLTEEDEQEQLIGKLMKAFHPRRPILLKHSNIKSKSKESGGYNTKQHIANNNAGNEKEVSWSRSVEQLQAQFMSKSHKRYPKEQIVKSALIEMHANQNKIIKRNDDDINQNNDQKRNNAIITKGQSSSRYCWRCFKRLLNKEILQLENVDNTRQFCSSFCLDAYKKQSQQFDSKQQAQYLQERDLQYVQNRNSRQIEEQKQQKQQPYQQTQQFQLLQEEQQPFQLM